ncbi:hypothetical protein [Streptomyces sp. NBC_01760]|uniref:hypothetical protein n=1 Tax=Streptomyces sp. NBC_01760 TaxID=2975931 RepID=UPI002DD8BAAF|nr:hypothetical protein [Streptomyces sp. NBC_01760]WSC72185.1 hypothetical protein OG807_28965 [Streptomyces sp. NBC_01760]
MWFHDPDFLLPAIRRSLAPGGRLVFSHYPPVPGCYGVSGSYGFGNRGSTSFWRRWNYPPQSWQQLLTVHGFEEVHAEVLEGPEPDQLGTLLVQAKVAAA